MSNKVFLADVDVFIGKTLDQMTRVARKSIDDVVAIAQTPVAKGGNMPVDTGALRNSLVASLNGSEKARGDKDAGKDSETSMDAVFVVTTLFKAGDIARFEWAASYARARHYMVGVGQGGGAWRDAAVQRWPQIVRKNAGQVK
jgi:hypothetical protein